MKTILLIEDNFEIRENTAELLELAGYKMLTAENGKIGVEKAKEFLPDLIICDIMMPELDGYGTLHILSKNAQTASIPFIFLTAKAEKTDFRKGMNLGADDYLTKPFEELDLLDTIERRLNKIDKIRLNSNVQPEEKLNHFYSEAKSLQKLESLSEDREIVSYQKKQLLFTEGSYPHKVFFLQKGKVKSYRSNDIGKELITDVYQAGDFIGYLSILENKPYQESAMALEDCVLAIIPKDDFFKLLHNDRDVAHYFIKLLSNNLTEKEARLIQLAYDSVRHRVADSIIRLVEKNDSENLTLQMSREDLANLVGTSKETVIRTISDFKDEKLIRTKGNVITILDIEKLRYIVG